MGKEPVEIDPNKFAQAFVIANGKNLSTYEAFKTYRAAFEIAEGYRAKTEKESNKSDNDYYKNDFSF